jgi:hypothetical protein
MLTQSPGRAERPVAHVVDRRRGRRGGRGGAAGLDDRRAALLHGRDEGRCTSRRVDQLAAGCRRRGVRDVRVLRRRVVAPDRHAADVDTWLPVFCGELRQRAVVVEPVIAVKLAGSMSGAFSRAISALVLAGLPTTSTLTLRLAWSLRALPWPRRSSRSRAAGPCAPCRDRADARRPAARRRYREGLAGSSVCTTPCSVGKAQSSSSMRRRERVQRRGISSSCRITGLVGPSSWPEAMRKAS